MEQACKKQSTLKVRQCLSILVFFCIAVFFCFVCNYHLLYSEQLQIFQFTIPYFQSFLKYPGGITGYLSSFLMQFYYINHLGGVIISFLLFVLFHFQRKFLNYYDGETFDILAFIPVFFFICFFTDINACIGSILSVNIAFACALLIISPGGQTWKYILSVFLLPVLYWSIGGGVFTYSGLLITGYLFSKKRNFCHLFALFLFTILIPLSVQKTAAPVSWDILFTGKSFYRGEMIPPYTIYLILLPIAIPVFAWLLKKGINHFSNKQHTTICYALFVLIVSGGSWMICQKFDKKEETVFKLDYLMKKELWKEMIHTSEKEKNNNSVFVSYTNIALLKENQLAEKLFHFSQNKEINEFWTSEHLPLFLTGELYFHLNIFNMARAYIFMANTQTPGCCSPYMFKRLTELALIRGEKQVAIKYIQTLKNSLFYRKWAIGMEQSVLMDHYPEELQYKINTFNPSESFFAKEMIYNLEQEYKVNKNNKAAGDFLKIKYILAKNYNAFMALFPDFDSISMANWPRIYQEFILMYFYIIKNDTMVLKKSINKQILDDFYQYIKINQSSFSKDEIRKLLASKYGHTYWYYMQYK